MYVEMRINGILSTTFFHDLVGHSFLLYRQGVDSPSTNIFYFQSSLHLKPRIFSRPSSNNHRSTNNVP